jgi:hypothetical protein
MAMMEMYLQGVSTRKVKAVTEELCGHEFSSATITLRVLALKLHHPKTRGFDVTKTERSTPRLFERVRPGCRAEQPALPLLFGALPVRTEASAVSRSPSELKAIER